MHFQDLGNIRFNGALVIRQGSFDGLGREVWVDGSVVVSHLRMHAQGLSPTPPYSHTAATDPLWLDGLLAPSSGCPLWSLI